MRLAYGFAGALLLGILMLYPVLGVTSSTGSPPQYGGGPADFGTCQLCHSSFDLNSGSGSIEIDAPEEYVPGMIYSFTITIDNTTPQAGDDAVQGFMVSVQDAEGNYVGELVVTDGDNTRFASAGIGQNYVTHTYTGRLHDTWTVDWIAPLDEDAPEVATIYLLGNAADGDGSPAGDYIYLTTAPMERSTVSAEDAGVPGAFALAALYPNPVRTSGMIELVMERPLAVTLTVHDGLGRTVRSADLGVLAEGTHELSLPADGLPAGVYFARVTTPAGELVRAFTVVR
jgi:hypothetical protein